MKKHTASQIIVSDNSLTRPDLQSATNPRKTIPGESKSIRQNIIRIFPPAPNPEAFVPSFGLASPDEGARGAVGNIPIQCRLKQTERMTNKFKLKQNQHVFCSNFDQLANHVQKSLEKCVLQRVCYIVHRHWLKWSFFAGSFARCRNAFAISAAFSMGFSIFSSRIRVAVSLNGCSPEHIGSGGHVSES